MSTRFAKTAKNIPIKPKLNQIVAGNSEYESRIKELQSQLSVSTFCNFAAKINVHFYLVIAFIY